MSNLVRLPNPRQIKEQAAEWIVGLEEGLTDEQRQQLQLWLQADPAHRDALVRMAELWDAFDALAELATTFPLAERGRQRSAQFGFRSAAVAAAVLLGIAVAAATGYLLTGHRLDLRGGAVVAARSSAVPPPNSPRAGRAPDNAVRAYLTPVGKRLTATLADGSVLTLNTDTSLQVEYSATQRLVHLKKGEANFSVARDPSRPFKVQVGLRVVQALGTVFNVRLGASEDVQVTVSEGTVRVLDRQQQSIAGATATAIDTAAEVLVRAGEQAVVGGGLGQVQRLELSQIAANQAWQRGLLIYTGESLDAVIADVSRYTTVHFVISDDSIRTRRVGGVFRAGDVDGLLTALRRSFAIDARRTGDVIVLSGQR